jgi:hypothetical protein
VHIVTLTDSRSAQHTVERSIQNHQKKHTMTVTVNAHALVTVTTSTVMIILSKPSLEDGDQ